jgi:hypothetical protein
LVLERDSRWGNPLPSNGYHFLSRKDPSPKRVFSGEMAIILSGKHPLGEDVPRRDMIQLSRRDGLTKKSRRREPVTKS